MSRLIVSVLGPLQVWLDGRFANPNFRTRKERALFAYLIVESKRRHRRDALGELLWPDRPEGYARTNLRQALYGLRRVLGDLARATESQDDILLFDLGTDLELDVHQFLNDIEFTLNHAHKRPETCSVCAGRWQAAVDLYRGDFLEDILLEDTQNFQEWVVYHREQYFRYLLLALRNLCDYYQSLGDLDQAHKFAWRYVNLAPLEEAAHRQLMSLLALSGERSAALEQFQSLQRLLKEELAVEPSPETLALHERIKSGLVLDISEHIVNLELTNLPLLLSPFFGREEELHQLETLLSDPHCRLMAITGLPGVGKTRLAQHLARENLDHFKDGVWIVPLREAHDEKQLQKAILQAVGLPWMEGQDLSTQIGRLLHPLNVLLVLDGFEQYQGDMALLSLLMRQSPGLRFLLTSRKRMSYQAACTLELAGLPYPADLEAANALTYPAVQLFMHRAQQVWPGFNLSPTNSALITEICRQIDGLPLALELAASRGRDLPLPDLKAELETGLEVLETGLQDLPLRQRSMQAALSSSWSGFPEQVKAIFPTLLTLSDGFKLEDARQAAGARPQDLQCLTDHFWLSNPAPGRFAFHPLARAYRHQQDRAPEVPDESTNPDQLFRRTSTGSLKTYHLQDPLTRLPGRVIFWDRLNHLLARSNRYQQQSAILLVELVGLAAEGIEEHDLLIQHAAQRITECVRRSDTLARFDRNRFAVLLEALKGPRDSLKVAAKICEAVGAPAEIAGKQIEIRAQVGISTYPWDGSLPDELVERAEKALTKARLSGTCCQLFTGSPTDHS